MSLSRVKKIDWLLQESYARSEGYGCICGIDEAGRGALAGPVVAACVVLPIDRIPEGVDDSKALSPFQRLTAFEEICRIARGIGIGQVEADEIDKINILRATHVAMRRALGALPGGLQPDLALIDGLPVRPFPISQWAIVKGDARCASIAAASIIAKVTRDRIMHQADEDFPDYGFFSHKGYPSPPHKRALSRLGPCAIHRLTYKPVAACIAERENLYAGREFEK